MTVHRAFAILGVLATLALAACGGDSGPGLDDRALIAQIERAGGARGLDAFRMPASDDLPRIPQDPKNPLTPPKVELGRLLYHETALLVAPTHEEGRGCASCASCHHAAAGFQAGVIQGIGDGGLGFGTAGEGRTADPAYAEPELDVQPIRSPSAMNGAYQEVMLWNGQFGGAPDGPNAGTQGAWTAGTPKETNELGYQGLETQAIAGLKVHRLSPIESTPAVTIPEYVALFAAAFPTNEPLGPEYGLREQAGLAIAAYERTLLANEAPFQRWLRGEWEAMSDAQKRGAAVFFGEGGCVACHTGPALNSMAFCALGMPDLPEGAPGVHGTVAGKPETRGRGGFTGVAADDYKFKVPQLYNLADVGFFGHGGTFRSVREVVEYMLAGVPANPAVPSSQLAPEFRPIALPRGAVDDLVAFLEEALRDPDLARYLPESLPSGSCFPNNDPQTREDLGFD